jgi:hypothetical protein
MEITKPALIEPGVKYFLKETLKRCHTFKESHNIFLLNISLFMGFLVILGVILLYKYKGKLTPKEIQIKDNEKQQYILSKIKNYQDTRLRESQNLITGLPKWE